MRANEKEILRLRALGSLYNGYTVFKPWQRNTTGYLFCFRRSLRGNEVRNGEIERDG